MKLILLLLPALFPLCQATKSELIPPVILVPGDGGSQIEARLDKPSIIHYLCTRKTDAWFDLWLNIELLVPLVIDCWVDNMRLVYNNVTRRTSNAPGVDTRVPGFGNTTTVEWLDPSMNRYTGYFKDMANTMVATLGYERGHSLRGAPFDFRRAPNEQEEYFVRLKWLVEDTYHRCNNQRVVLALHSMGGPMTWYFLKKQTQAWKDQYIEAVVGFAGAWGGSIKAVKVYAAGDNLGIYLLNALKVRAEQRSAASLAFLLPSRDLWGPEDVLIQTPTKNYTVNNFKDLFESLKLPDAYNMYLDTRDLLKGAPPPGVPIYCLYGVGIPTVEKLTYAAGKFPDSPNLLYGEGDGTVNLKSAQVCEGWSGKQKQPVHTKVFNKMEHMEILRTPETIQYFVDILKNITEKRKKLLEKRMQKREEERGDRGNVGIENIDPGCGRLAASVPRCLPCLVHSSPLSASLHVLLGGSFLHCVKSLKNYLPFGLTATGPMAVP
ncbi:hypothetical protein Pmani_017488 [Petrolisthes manimaculis]|uniref:Group XV phospholipase A2 n=1 Tax=Petrolisthes manimaculis TaxID=1843537 RepID=A0AAE1PPD0_9EUCA|nr:hypothetical protein Pmani_017488 [Petrolisthes manimaculis]